MPLGGATAVGGRQAGFTVARRAEVGLDPALSSFDWLIDASFSDSPINLGTLGLALDATVEGGDPEMLAFNAGGTGQALVGYALRDTAWDTGDGWLTGGVDITVTLPYGIPPCVAGDRAWAEMFNIPVTGGGEDTERCEFALVRELDGFTYLGLDFQDGIGDPEDQTYESSIPLCANEDGRPGPLVIRLQGVFATGVVTVSLNGVVWLTDPFHPFEMTAPEADEAVRVGGIDFVTPVSHVLLRSSIGGAALVEWTVGDTGWTLQGTSHAMSPLTAPAFAGADNLGWRIPDDALFSIPADESRTIVLSGRPTGPSSLGFIPFASYFAHLTAGNGPGFGVLYIPPAPVPDYSIAFLDGAGAFIAGLGDLPDGDTDIVQIVVVDRDEGEIRTYVDGVLVDTVPASGMLAINPSDGPDLLRSYGFIYKAGVTSEARTDIAELTAALEA